MSVAPDLSWNTFPLWRNLQQGLFTPLHLLTFYKAQIRPCLEYGSHLWRGASKYSLATLDTIQKRAIRLIDDSSLTDSLEEMSLCFPFTIDTITAGALMS